MRLQTNLATHSTFPCPRSIRPSFRSIAPAQQARSLRTLPSSFFAQHNTNDHTPLGMRAPLSPFFSQLQKSIPVGAASTVASIVAYPLGAAINICMADMRLPRVSDFNYKGIEANICRVFLKWCLLDAVNNIFRKSITMLCSQLNLDEKLSEDTIINLASFASVICISLLLCPIERVRQYQYQFGGSLIDAVRALAENSGISNFFRGTISSAISTLPNLLAMAWAQKIAQGDTIKEKKVLQRISMTMSPPRTYLMAVKQAQQTHGLPIIDAHKDMLASIVEGPEKLLVQIVMGLIYVKLTSEIFFRARNIMTNNPAQGSKTNDET